MAMLSRDVKGRSQPHMRHAEREISSDTRL